MNGLKYWEPDEEKRYKHIVENMIYVAELQPRNQFIWMCVVDPYDEYKLNLYTGSFLEDGFDRHMEEVWKVKRFQLILGNPPYQKSDGSGGKGSSAVPIYNLFTEKSLKITERLLYITPSRWFVTGKGLDGFRKMMIDNKGLKLIKHFPGNGSDLFGDSVDIKGGVSYFLVDNKDNDKLIINGKEIDKKIINKSEIILEDTRHYLILEKILKSHNNFFSDIVNSRNYFGLNINGKKTLQNGTDCVVEFDDVFSIKCYVSKKEGFIKYTKIQNINKNGLDKYKIFTTKGTSVGKLGNTFIGYPNEVCTETYLTILTDSKKQSLNILKYFKRFI
jgi:site-specific DNA-methyltransferase (adenine-specific)